MDSDKLEVLLHVTMSLCFIIAGRTLSEEDASELFGVIKNGDCADVDYVDVLQEKIIALIREKKDAE